MKKMLIATCLLVASCSTDHTRGIGIYPGDPDEDFSPELRTDTKTYRNIALGRAVYQSSAFDYNFTGHLLTDGIIDTEKPSVVKVITPDGLLPKREREWSIDGNNYSANILNGEDTYLLYDFGGAKYSADAFRITGMFAEQEGRSAGACEITLLGSSDGGKWTVLGSKKSSRPLGTRHGKNFYSPVAYYSFDEVIPISVAGEYSFYKLLFKQKGASQCSFPTFALLGADGNPLDLLSSNQFSSVWISEDNAEEWVYVDLGVRSRFDKVILHWLERGEGKIQTSDDARQWKDIATVPMAEGNTDEITCSGDARYVRLLLQKPATSTSVSYALSEVEVMGRGGLITVPRAQPLPTKDALTLSGGAWKVQRKSQVQASGEEIATAAYDDGYWLTATVPGTVLTSYIKAGALPDPNFGNNVLQISESFFRDDFWYRDEFTLPSGWEDRRLLLNFDGINWKANIFLNGQKIGHIDGGFIRGQFDVSTIAHSGTNYLAVEIIKNEHFGAVKEKCRKNTDYNGGILGADNPTFHASIGWDWISTVRGRNSGIWNDVRLTATGNITLQDPLVQTILNLPDTTSARISSEVVVKNHSEAPVEGMLEGRIGDIVFSKAVSLQGRESKTISFSPSDFPQLNVTGPRLWWPHGYGSPYLYDASFSFVCGSDTSDVLPFKAGLRQVTFSEDGGVLVLYVNGRRFIGRGGNWGFSEHNLNYRGREYDIAVGYHADMNFTMIRNWVAQTGDDEFFEACDRHGIMVWQDFWLANPADGPDPYDNGMFMANASDFLGRIRHHPSICLYCGRNEGYPPKQLDDALRQLVKDDHSDIHYISSSADDVVSGRGPYNMLPPRAYFEIENGRDKFHSERGMPCVMNFESLCRTMEPDSLWPQSVSWYQHDYTMEGAQRCATFNDVLGKAFGEISDARQFCDLAQWMNYDGYRAMFESRSYARKGLLLWMTHPAWPSMVWQTYDYYFEPTAAYFGCKKANEPLHIQWNPSTDKVEVVNYSAGERQGLSASAQIINSDGSVAWEKTVNVDSHEDTTEECIDLVFPSELSAAHFIKLRLTGNGKSVSDNFYIRGSEDGNFQSLNDLPKSTIKTVTKINKDTDGNWTATVTLRNTSSTPAIFIRINIVGISDKIQILPIHYSDNYFSLLPEEEKEVTITWKDEDTRKNLPNISVSGFNI